MEEMSLGPHVEEALKQVPDRALKFMTLRVPGSSVEIDVPMDIITQRLIHGASPPTDEEASRVEVRFTD